MSYGILLWYSGRCTPFTHINNTHFTHINNTHFTHINNTHFTHINNAHFTHFTHFTHINDKTAQSTHTTLQQHYANTHTHTPIGHYPQ